MKTYGSLFRLNKNQDGEPFAVFHGTKSDNGTDYEAPFKLLAQKTIEGYDAWRFKQSRFISAHRSEVQKLRNYLNYTFVRIQDLELLEPTKQYFKYSKDRDRVCFNTGLQNPHQADLIATFHKATLAPGKTGCDWVYRGTFPPNEDGYRRFFEKDIPDIAWYSKDSRDFVFDTEYTLENDTFDHLFERAKTRAGLASATDEAIRNYLRGTLDGLVPKIKRNYKIAIPVYYVKEKRMQLLLPFPSASSKEEYAGFLVERDDVKKMYHLKTIFDLDQAYFSARLITRPDEEWLNP